MPSSSVDSLKSSCEKEMVVIQDIVKTVSGEAYYNFEHTSFPRIPFLLHCVLLIPIFITADTNLMLQNRSHCRYLIELSEITSPFQFIKSILQ
jgi:hypothetical protein